MLDDGWSDPERGPDGCLRADTQRFPSGMPALAAYLRARGLELGIYSDSGGLQGRHSQMLRLDASQFAALKRLLTACAGLTPPEGHFPNPS